MAKGLTLRHLHASFRWITISEVLQVMTIDERITMGARDLDKLAYAR